MDFDGYEKLKLEEDYVDEVIYNSDNIICFKSFNKEDDFIEEWQDIQASVAGNIQANLEELGLKESLAWNIYIIFTINFELEKYLKNKVESNKFCCKKYVINVDDIQSKEQIKSKIENTIALFSNFDFSEGNHSSSNRDRIKEKIFENSNKSTLMNKFKNTQQIYSLIETDSISSFINELKSEYSNEN